MNVFLSLLVLLLAALPAGASDGLRIEPGERVKAKGDWLGDSRLAAWSLSRKDRADSDFEIAGRVAEVDGATGAFRIESIWIEPDEAELDRRALRLARRFEPGNWVKAEGAFDSAGRLVADSIERLKPDEAIASIEGLVDAIEPSSEGTTQMRIGPVTVTWSADAGAEEGR
jgi:hypothetical protein